jgi:hypothetical protein
MVRAHLHAYINSLAILLHFYNCDKGFHTVSTDILSAPLEYCEIGQYTYTNKKIQSTDSTVLYTGGTMHSKSINESI